MKDIVGHGSYARKKRSHKFPVIFVSLTLQVCSSRIALVKVKWYCDLEDLQILAHVNAVQTKGKLKLDPVGSTVRYEMMKLCTGSV